MNFLMLLGVGGGVSGGAAPTDSFLLLEDGFYLLLEDGFKLILES